MTIQNRPQLSVYTMGTISGAAGQLVITGVGTNWVVTDPSSGNTTSVLTGGDVLITATGPIPIKSVDSATQITLECPLPTAFAVGSAYRILKYSQNATGATLLLQTQLQLQGSDAQPDLSRTVDNGFGRAKLRVASTGDIQLAVGPTGALDAALVPALDISPAGLVGFPAGIAGANLKGKNLLINGNFAINQRAVSGTVTLAAGAYGHDRWKAGANGCTYTFAPSGADTILTITAGSLLQIIEGANVPGTTYIASQGGTSQIRLYQGSATGSFATGATLPLTVTPGSNLVMEASTGTLTLAQVEAGVVTTPFERRQPAIELIDCQKYYVTMVVGMVFYANGAGSNYRVLTTISLPVQMRTSPTVTVGASSTFNNGNMAVNAPTSLNFQIYIDPVAAGGVYDYGRTITASAEL